MKGWLAGVLVVAGCHSADRSAAIIPPSAAVVLDSMILAVPGGRTVWLAEGREARDSAGTPCVERSVEIRTDSGRLKVPLLFVRRGPTVLDREHLRAELSRNCRVMAIYSVDLATGRPVKLGDR